MKRRILAVTLFSFLLALPATAQITIDRSWLEGTVGRRNQSLTYRVSDTNYPALSTILDATGPGRTYDFSGFDYEMPTGLVYDVLTSAAETPGADHPAFAASNYVNFQRLPNQTDAYVYHELRDDGHYTLGSITISDQDLDGDGAPDQSVFTYDPPSRPYVFPMTDGTSWEETLTYTQTTGTFSSQTTISNDYVVEGWGTLVTPAGSAPALRLRQTYTMAVGETSVSNTLIHFVTDELLGAFVQLDAEGNVFPGQAWYWVQTATGTAAETIAPRGFRLEANYPNPFDDATTFAFELERAGHVTLGVFDLLGREVARLVDAQLPSGRHTFTFRAEGLPAGLYLSRLQLEGAAVSRRVVLRK